MSCLDVKDSHPQKQLAMDSKFVNAYCRTMYGKDLRASKLVMKIDLLVMTYVCLTQFINILGM